LFSATNVFDVPFFPFSYFVAKQLIGCPPAALNIPEPELHHQECQRASGGENLGRV
jgi:hypothetical protein